ncbi:MAG: Spy/CpxP family protein refolding chaperone [Muribaculaceae bacterium]
MKNIIFIIMIALVTATSTTPLNAQSRKRNNEQKERFFIAKMKMVQQELNLTEAQTNSFTPIYRAYNNEMSNIFDNYRAKEHNMPKATVAQAEKVVNERINMKSDILKLQKRYYSKFAKVLTAEQLLRFEDAERKIQFQIMKRHSNRDKSRKQE